MKTSTLLLIGAIVAGAYFLFFRNNAAPATPTDTSTSTLSSAISGAASGVSSALDDLGDLV
jgi:hypothetical protein